MLLIVSIHFIQNLISKKAVNLFLSLLLFYITITIFKRIAIILDPSMGAVSYFLGGAFQILFGIGFIFVDINTKSFPIIKD